MNENQDSETCSGAESLQNSTKHDSIQNEISSKNISEDNTPTVLRALHEKYGSTCDEQFEFKICVATSAPGMTESGKLILPCVIGLNCLNISAAGDSEELSTLCQKVTELDLSHNNISQLTEVISLLQALQRLHFLNLSYNPLHLSADLTNAQLSHIPDDVPLSKLALNNTRLSWSNLWSLMAKLKNLEELHLSINGIDHVTAPDVDVTYPKLKRIYLYENNISDVEDILMIGHIFPRLQNLVLADNPIENIDMEADVIKETFPCLEDLNLTSCKLSNWKAFATLQNFPQLKHLRVLRVPLMEKFEKQLCRKLVIAYLPNITHLNGTRVEAAEREDAERAFIRHYMDKEERPTRYEELHRIYGDLDPLVDVDLSPNEKVNITVAFNGRTELREVELKWTLTKLKNDLEKTFVHHPAKAFRIYHDDRVNQAPEYMRYPTRTLLRYHLKDGDHLIIDLNNKNS